MSLLVAFLTALLLVLLVPSLVVLLVACCWHPWSLFMALLVPLGAVTNAPAAANCHCGGVPSGMLTVLLVSLVCALLLPPPMAAPVAPMREPALSPLPALSLPPPVSLPAAGPPARLGALWGRWTRRAGGSDVEEVK